jgi:hypothetical protein
VARNRSNADESGSAGREAPRSAAKATSRSHRFGFRTIRRSDAVGGNHEFRDDVLRPISRYRFQVLELFSDEDGLRLYGLEIEGPASVAERFQACGHAVLEP